MLRIKVDDKLYRPITHYRDTILHLVDYFEHHRSSVPPSFWGDKRGAFLPTAYLYAGRVFADLGDAPQALDYYQRALDALPETPSANSGYSARRLYKQRGLLHSFMGELFHLQGLYRESLESFKQANHWAKLANDTLDMIFNYRDIAEQYKFINENDSSLLFYQKASSLSDRVGNNYMSIEIKGQIGSLYNKLGKYHLALSHARPMLEGLDSLHYSSTYAILSESYYELGQEDSAEFYLEKLQQFGNLYGKEYAFEHLSQLALKKHDLENAHYYFLLSKQYDDSLRKLDKAEAVAHMHAAYNYSIQEKEAQKYKVANEHKRNIIIFVVMIAIILSLMMLWLLSKYRIRQQRLIEMEHAHEELRNKYQLLTEDHQKKLAETDLLLQQKDKDIKELQFLTQKREDILHAQKLALIEKEKIEANTEYIQNTQIFRKVIHNPESIRNHEEAWEQIEHVVNDAYPGFSDRLKKFIPKINKREKKISLLLKAHIGHQMIADILCVTQNGESNIRRRLSGKILPEETPSATKFDGFIESL